MAELQVQSLVPKPYERIAGPSAWADLAICTSLLPILAHENAEVGMVHSQDKLEEAIVRVPGMPERIMQ